MGYSQWGRKESDMTKQLVFSLDEAGEADPCVYPISVSSNLCHKYIQICSHINTQAQMDSSLS